MNGLELSLNHLHEKLTDERKTIETVSSGINAKCLQLYRTMWKDPAGQTESSIDGLLGLVQMSYEGMISPRFGRIKAAEFRSLESIRRFVKNGRTLEESEIVTIEFLHNYCDTAKLTSPWNDETLASDMLDQLDSLILVTRADSEAAGDMFLQDSKTAANFMKYLTLGAAQLEQAREQFNAALDRIEVQA